MISHEEIHTIIYRLLIEIIGESIEIRVLNGLTEKQGESKTRVIKSWYLGTY